MKLSVPGVQLRPVTPSTGELTRVPSQRPGPGGYAVVRVLALCLQAARADPAVLADAELPAADRGQARHQALPPGQQGREEPQRHGVPGRARDFLAEFRDEIGTADQILAVAGKPAEGHPGDGRAGVLAEPYHLGGGSRQGAADLAPNGVTRVSDPRLRVAEELHASYPFRLDPGPACPGTAPGRLPTPGAAASCHPARRWPR